MTPITENNTLHTEDTREFMELLDGTKVPVASKKEVEGHIIKVAKGKGRHAMEAQEVLQESVKDGNESEVKANKIYTTSLMSQLITINDKYLSVEDIKDLDLVLYNNAYRAFIEVNF